MKKFILFALMAVLLVTCQKPVDQTVSVPTLKKATIVSNCNTIQSGLITNSSGSQIKLGFDQWGYNYQALLFNGFYDNNGRPSIPVSEGDKLEMKWNEAWLSNKDCNSDSKLDRHFGFDSYVGSGAWLTNHQSGVYTDANGNNCKWTYFCKIVAVPADAKLVGGKWINSNGTEIGPAIWGDFATTEEIYNDPCAGDHGVLYKSPAGPGFGKYMP